MALAFKKKKREQALLRQALVSAQAKIKDNQPLTPSENQSLGRNSFHNIKRTQPQVRLGTTPPPREKRVIVPPTTNELQTQRSIEAVQSFTKDAFIKAPLPANFNYTKLDMPEGFVGIYGFDSQSKARVTGLAHNRTATPEEVARFLKTDADSIPNMAKNQLSHISPPETLPQLPMESGLNAGKLWHGALQNGEQVAIVYLERSDKKGSYLFVLSGPNSYFERNDGAFDSLYDNARTLDEKGQ